MDQFHLMQIYVAVAEEQGFAAASRRLKLSPPAVTRAVSALEEQLGIKLLNRTTRFVRTTDAGARYLEDAKRILLEVERVNEAVLGINANPKGLLSVTAPVLFGQKYVVPGIVDYLSTYPETQVNAVFLDRVVNLLEEGFDVGVRIGELPDSSMHARKVGHVHMMLVAAPEYLEQRGTPKHVEELKQHSLITAMTGNMAQDWHFMQNQKKLSLRIQSRFNVTTNQAAINAAKQGLGITRIISYQVEEEIAKGELQRILPEFTPPPIPIHIIHREGRMSSNKVRRFIDLMTERLQNDPALHTSLMN
jgi:DNA-binding transcriptional LysR family regulator